MSRCPNEGCHATLAEDGRCYPCEDGTDDPQRAWELFVESRPEVVRDLIKKYNLAPNRYYQLPLTGEDYYQTYSFSENGTVTLIRYGAKTNKPRWRVFGVDPAELIFWRERPWSDYRK